MLKEKYTSIVFPIENGKPNFIIKIYLSEFSFEAIENIDQLTTVFFHALRDYLNKSIGEWEFGSLCFYFLTDKNVSFLLNNEVELKRIITDCVDIKWLSDSESFNAYLDFLRRKLHDFEISTN